MNTHVKVEASEKPCFVQEPAKRGVNSIVHDSALNARNRDVAEFFYSSAQHACIASYLAEDMYGIETAQAVLALFCADSYTGNISKSILRKFPGLMTSQDTSRKSVFNSFGVDADLIHSDEVQRIIEIMDAIEHRDVLKKHHSDVLSVAPSEIEIAQMTARQARTALTLRIVDIFDTQKIQLDAKTSLRESSLSDIFPLQQGL